jgi:hypothetical protein
MSFSIFAGAESVAAAASTALIGDVIDLGANGEQLGDGEELYLVIQCATSIITGGAAGTIKFQLASDAQAAIAVDGSASVHIDTGTFVTDGDDANELDAGAYIYVGRIPNGHAVAYERYLGVLCTIATTTVTAGAINAFLTKDAPRNVIYPANTGDS